MIHWQIAKEQKEIISVTCVIKIHFLLFPDRSIDRIDKGLTLGLTHTDDKERSFSFMWITKKLKVSYSHLYIRWSALNKEFSFDTYCMNCQDTNSSISRCLTMRSFLPILFPDCSEKANIKSRERKTLSRINLFSRRSYISLCLWLNKDI